MSGERILNFKSARGLGKNILQKGTRIFLVWLKYQKWKYVIDLRLLRFPEPFVFFDLSDHERFSENTCYQMLRGILRTLNCTTAEIISNRRAIDHCGLTLVNCTLETLGNLTIFVKCKKMLTS